MSLLNCWLTPTEALVAVDTDGVGRDGSRKPMSKLLPIPHLNAVIGHRGQGAFLWSVAQACLSGGFHTFDEMLDALPAIVQDVELNLPGYLKVDRFSGNEMIAVGWSQRRSKMLARTFVKHGLSDFSIRDSQGVIAPWDESMGVPKTLEALEDIARAQVEWMQEKEGLGGGALVVCRLTKDSMTMEHKMKFEEVTA
jgi:hypothetical protein